MCPPASHTPLQGKSDPFPALSAARGAWSAFSLKERKGRVEVSDGCGAVRSISTRPHTYPPPPSPQLLLSQQDRVAVAANVPAAEASSAFRRLRDTFVQHFDGLQLYHEVWPSLTLLVVPGAGDGSGWYSDELSRQLRVPHDFKPAELVGFLQRHLPRVLKRRAGGRASQGGAAEQQQRQQAHPHPAQTRAGTRTSSSPRTSSSSARSAKQP